MMRLVAPRLHLLPPIPLGTRLATQWKLMTALNRCLRERIRLVDRRRNPPIRPASEPILLVVLLPMPALAQLRLIRQRTLIRLAPLRGLRLLEMPARIPLTLHHLLSRRMPLARQLIPSAPPQQHRRIPWQMMIRLQHLPRSLAVRLQRNPPVRRLPPMPKSIRSRMTRIRTPTHLPTN